MLGGFGKRELPHRWLEAGFPFMYFTAARYGANTERINCADVLPDVF